MIRWLRVVGWSTEWLALVAAFYIFWAACVIWLEWWFDVPGALAQVRPAGALVILGGGTVLYAVGRGACFHPVFEPAYHRWLATTPWTSRKPLPFGPVHLVPQDAFLVGSTMLLARLGGDGWALWVPQVFLAVYLALVAQSLLRTGCWPWGYAVAFGLGLGVWLWRDPPACLGAELLTYAAAYLGLRQSLACFPWGMEQSGPPHGTDPNAAARPLGWPFDRLAPRTPEPQVHLPLYRAALLSLLVGWWTFVAFSLVPYDPDLWKLSHLVLFAVVLFGALVRVIVYCDGYAPPISLRGRLATGRWIIPGYDKVFVAPLLALAAACVLAGASAFIGLNPLFSDPVAIAVVLFICLGMGPSLHAWRLTGDHRIVEGCSMRTKESVRVG